MKYSTTALLTIVITTYSYCQSSFNVEGKSVKTGRIVKTYNFYYQTKDSITLFFSDSIATFTNPANTIKKEITYSDRDKEPGIRIEYLKTNKNDSICKLFTGHKLAMVYETRFDKLNRIIYYSMKRFWPNDGEDDGFEWTYDYQDSLTNFGKLTKQTVFVDDAYGDKRFHFRVISEFDRKNRKVKETRESEANDSMAQITTYIYDNNDSLLEERVKTGGYENVFPHTKNHINTPCDITKERTFAVSKFSDFGPLIKQLLIENNEMLNSNDCENFICTYISPDKQIIISIRKVRPYWEGGRNVSVILTKGSR